MCVNKPNKQTNNWKEKKKPQKNIMVITIQ